MTWRALMLPILVGAAFVALAAIIVLPDRASLSQSRPIALGVTLGAAAGIVGSLLQTWQASRLHRLEILRAAYRSMIGATQVMLEEQSELTTYPFGHAYQGIVGQVTDEYLRHDPFQQAKSLEADWRTLYVEGERELLLEADRNDEIFVAWRQVRKSFWAWVHRLETVTQQMRDRAEATKSAVEFELDEDAELRKLDAQLRADIDAFSAICRSRVKALS
jgi:hypothetical protein